MKDSRHSRCSDTDQNVISVDGVPIPGRKDFGCQGDEHLYTVVTTLAAPTYTWYIDSINNPPVSNKPSFRYTFDDKTHSVLVKTQNASCSILSGLEAKGVACKPCDNKCVQQTVTIPPGELVLLIDEFGRKIKIDGKLTTECKSPSKTNFLAAKCVVRAIRGTAECKTTTLNANIYVNGKDKNCLTLQIINSPIKLKTITVGSEKYTFNTSSC